MLQQVTATENVQIQIALQRFVIELDVFYMYIITKQDK